MATKKSVPKTKVKKQISEPIAVKEPNKIIEILKAIGDYFKNSWKELKNVLWPNRKSTWAMIVAVIVFSAFFIILITVLDIAFDELFNLIIK